MACTEYIPLAFMVIGLGALAFGFVSRRSNIRCSRCTVPCDAEIVSVRCEIGSDTDLYLPTFRHTVGGTAYLSESRMGSSSEGHYVVGDVYRMYYDPEDPRIMCRRGMNEIKRWPNAIIAAGAVVLAAGGVCLAAAL